MIQVILYLGKRALRDLWPGLRFTLSCWPVGSICASRGPIAIVGPIPVTFVTEGLKGSEDLGGLDGVGGLVASRGLEGLEGLELLL